LVDRFIGDQKGHADRWSLGTPADLSGLVDRRHVRLERLARPTSILGV
jgi:hypothetical protein